MRYLKYIHEYKRIKQKKSGRNLIRIPEEVCGRVPGKIIGSFYAWFFFTLTSLNLMDRGNFTKFAIMEKTPAIVLILISTAIPAWAVRHGVRVVTRYSPLFSVTALVILVVSVLLVLNLVNFQNFLPMFDQPAIKYIEDTHILVTEPFGEVVAFLMIAPNVECPAAIRRNIICHCTDHAVLL